MLLSEVQHQWVYTQLTPSGAGRAVGTFRELMLHVVVSAGAQENAGNKETIDGIFRKIAQQHYYSHPSLEAKRSYDCKQRDSTMEPRSAMHMASFAANSQLLERSKSIVKATDGRVEL